MSASPVRSVVSAEYARALRDNPIWPILLQETREEIQSEWGKAESLEAREACYHAMRALEAVVARITRLAARNGRASNGQKA